MQVRVCVQNYDNGDVQGFLYIDDGTGEALVTTGTRGTAMNFNMSGSRSSIDVDCEVDVGGRMVGFRVTYGGSMTPSFFTQPLAISTANC